MLRNKRPYFFKVGNEKFKTIKLGYLTGGELVLKYTPVLTDLIETFNNSESTLEALKEKRSTTLDIKAIVEKLPENVIRQLCEDTFEKTYVGTTLSNEETGDEQTSWDLINPEDFESLDEMYRVALEVLKYNFPSLSFLVEGDDTEGEVSKPITEQKYQPQKSTPEQEIVRL